MADFCYQAPPKTTPNTKLINSNSTYKLILEKARGYWFEILRSNGIDQNFLRNKHGACPVCGGKDRFRFDDKEGSGSYYCNQCGPGGGLRLLQLTHNCDFKTALMIVARALGINISSEYSGPKQVGHYLKNFARRYPVCETSENEKQKRVHKLNRTWLAASPIYHGDPVQYYLEARGLTLNSFPAVLRYHPALPYYEKEKLIGVFPAMLGLVTDGHNGPVTLHRTYLGYGKKADVQCPKKLMPPIYLNATKGAAIKLYQPNNGILAVSEGIETGLSFSLATKIPVWAAISANGLRNIILPSEIREVTIIVDNDLSGVGQKAAADLARRLLQEGRQVKRVMPPKVGQDMNDLLLEVNQ